MAAAARFEGQPISRILTAFEEHCSTCPGKARIYANAEEMVRLCGGWPGDGSDECHGNCLCGLEPATEFSIFGQTTEGLLTPTGPTWTPRSRDLDHDEWVQLLAALAPLVADPIEYLVIYDRTGRQLARAAGDATSVRLPPGDWRGAAIAHTHSAHLDPPLHGLDPDDLAVLAWQQPHLGALVYQWNGRVYLQTVTAESGTWPAEEELVEALKIEFIRALSGQRSGRLSRSEDPMHLALEQVAQRFRLSYSRTEVER